ncbi:replication initiator protein A [Chromobacterium violaceum]|uniref:replication initiator protein A n=1 Tax=Chromobacterium violaceum TaxID=536 RepID=UPI0035A7263B
MDSLLQQFLQLPKEQRKNYLRLLNQQAQREMALHVLLTLPEQISWLLAKEKQDGVQLQFLKQKAEQRLALLLRLLSFSKTAPDPLSSIPCAILPQAPLEALETRSWKSDNFSLELPLFALSCRDIPGIWQWQNRDGSRQLSIQLRDSTLGRATVYDRELLVYFCSQLCQHQFGATGPLPNRLRFGIAGFLRDTGRDQGGRSYRAVEKSLQRLCNTEFDYRQEGLKDIQQPLLASWTKLISSGELQIEVELSPWLLDAVQQRRVLSLHPGYLQLRKPLAKRLYELARKHCGRQREWRIGIDALHLKSGSQASRREFRRMLKTVLAEGPFPGYQLLWDASRDQLLVVNRDSHLPALHPRFKCGRMTGRRESNHPSCQNYGKLPTLQREISRKKSE